MDNKIECNINGKTVEIRKIPLVKYPKIIESLKALSAHKELFSDLSNDSIMEALPQILIVATPEVIKIINVATDIPEEELTEWGLDDFVKCIESLFQVNNYQYVYTTLKKAMSSFKTQQPGQQQIAKVAGTDGTQKASQE